MYKWIENPERTGQYIKRCEYRVKGEDVVSVINCWLKLDLNDKNNKPTNKLKIRILSQTSILYLIPHASVILIIGLHL